MDNFQRMANDINFSDALTNTLEIVIVAVPLQLALALGMAMMLRHVGRGRDILLWVWSIPLGISDLAAGLVWLAILNDQGYLNSLLFHLGLIGAPHSWLTYETPVALFVAIVVTELWRATAIVLVILVAGVQTLPGEYLEAAEVFGATPWKRFLRVVLPLLRPSIQTALILRTVLAFEMFAIVLTLGGRNFPVLVSEAFNWQYANQDYGVAAAYAVVVMAFSIGATLIYLRVLRVPAAQR
jgi:multiple sugar transport system permease protein